VSSPTRACAAALSFTTECQLLAGVLLLLNAPHRHACVLHPSAPAAASWVGALHVCPGGSAQRTGRMPAAEKMTAAAAGRAHHTPSLARSASSRQMRREWHVWMAWAAVATAVAAVTHFLNRQIASSGGCKIRRMCLGPRALLVHAKSSLHAASSIAASCSIWTYNSTSAHTWLHGTACAAAAVGLLHTQGPASYTLFGTLLGRCGRHLPVCACRLLQTPARLLAWAADPQTAHWCHSQSCEATPASRL
jgi:hypothetical protein